MARRSQPKPVVSTGNFADHAREFDASAQTPANYRVSDYTPRKSRPSLDDLYRELDGAVAHQNGVNWRLRILAIHEAGADRWIQLSVTCGSMEHDLVLHMAPPARTCNVVASIEAWFEHSVLTGRTLDVL